MLRLLGWKDKLDVEVGLIDRSFFHLPSKDKTPSWPYYRISENHPKSLQNLTQKRTKISPAEVFERRITGREEREPESFDFRRKRILVVSRILKPKKTRSTQDSGIETRCKRLP